MNDHAYDKNEISEDAQSEFIGSCPECLERLPSLDNVVMSDYGMFCSIDCEESYNETINHVSSIYSGKA